VKVENHEPDRDGGLALGENERADLLYAADLYVSGVWRRGGVVNLTPEVPPYLYTSENETKGIGSGARS
jgi:hypothetical protein